MRSVEVRFSPPIWPDSTSGFGVVFSARTHTSSLRSSRCSCAERVPVKDSACSLKSGENTGAMSHARNHCGRKVGASSACSCCAHAAGSPYMVCDSSSTVRASAGGSPAAVKTEIQFSPSSSSRCRSAHSKKMS